MKSYSESPLEIIPDGEATGHIPIKGHTPIRVIGNERIRSSFDSVCLQQAVNSRLAPGVSDLILNPDAHAGDGAPVGSVLVSDSHIYPGPVGVDIKCSMSLLQTDLPAEVVKEREIRRQILDSIAARIPTGAGKGQRSVLKAKRITPEVGKELLVEGASATVCRKLGIDESWAAHCEDSVHVGADGGQDSVAMRLDELLERGILPAFERQMEQLGSYGGGNHFGEANVVAVKKNERAQEIAQHFGLQDGKIAFLSHCGSRGFGHTLASNQFRHLQQKFSQQNIALPGNDKELVFAELGTRDADDYLNDMALGSNFATLNHLLINALVLEAFQEVVPGCKGHLVYFISHNIARKEQVNGKDAWVHRKGATRAFPAGHPALKGSTYEMTGHPILLPGNPIAGSAIMVAETGAHKSCFSVNHGAGRAMGRRAAARALNQKAVDQQFADSDVLSNCRFYPIDEAPAAYKDFSEVLNSVEKAGLATTIAKLQARFVLKDSDRTQIG